MGPTPAFNPSAAYSVPAFDPGGSYQPATAAKTADTPAPEGFWHSLGAQFGLTPEVAQNAVQSDKDHPIKAAIMAALGPGATAAQMVYDQAKQSGSALSDAYRAAKSGNPAQAAVSAIQAVPVVGPALNKATDQYGSGNYKGEAGTLIGAAAQAAPAVLGVADAADVPRPNTTLANAMEKFPTRDKAGAIFNKLNTDLADQPVNLQNSAAPLQRAIEIGARGGTIPGPVSALLQRAQAVEPMTFPEARDYQASLSDLSASDKMAMNGRMKGAVAQLNMALYQDVRQAAEAGGGYGSDFDKAMSQYRQASTAKEAIEKVGKLAVKAAIGGGATAAGYGIIKDALGK
jgi:hypothetical protein